MDNANLLLLLLIECIFQTVKSFDCGQKKDQNTAVLVEWFDFPRGENPEFYVVAYQLLEDAHRKNSTNIPAAKRQTQHPAIWLDKLERSGEYEITIESVKNGNILSVKSFQTRGLTERNIRTVITSTSVSFYLTQLTGEFSVSVSLHNSSRTVQSRHPYHEWDNLKPGTRYSFRFQFKQLHPELINISQRLDIDVETGSCSPGWMAFKDSCYQINKQCTSWSDAQDLCDSSYGGAHLVNIKTEEEYSFISSYLRASNEIIMIWSGLNDRAEEGGLLWTDGSSFDLEKTETAPSSVLPGNDTDCYALRQNATGLNFIFTGFYCFLQLPYLCEYEFPAVPGDFTFHLEDVRETEAMFAWSDLQGWLKPGHQLVIKCYSAHSGDWIESLPPGTTRKSTELLSPGRFYSFVLAMRSPGGAQVNLSPVLRVETRPFQPRNLLARNVSSTDIFLEWDPPLDSSNASFHGYILKILDVDENKYEIRPEDKGKMSTIIRNLRPYHQYWIHLQSVAQGGSLSCDEDPILVVTGVSPPSKVFVKDVDEESLVLHWETLHSGHDFYIQVKSTAGTEHNVNYVVKRKDSLLIDFLTPGMSYEIGVATVQNGNMSEMKTITQTLKPKPVQIVIPYELRSNSAVLFVQMPDAGVFDGIFINSSEGLHVTLLLKNDGKVTIENLTPGTEYHFGVYTKSRDMFSSKYQMPAVKTCLAGPFNVREDKVTENSIQIVWDRAEGSFERYEVTCTNCENVFLVQKVVQEKATFFNLTPGTFYNFSVRTEKEHFQDSSPVVKEIQTVPSSVEYMSHNKTSESITVWWLPVRDKLDGYIISISNGVFNDEQNLLPTIRMLTFDSLLPGSDYVISIISTSGEKKSYPTSLMVSTYPDPPSDLQFFGQEENTVYMSWKLPRGGFHGFQLSYRLSGSHEILFKTTVNGSRASVTNLTPGTEYVFQIRTVRGKVSSAAVEKGIATKPPVICGLAVKLRNTSSATVMWNPTTTGNFSYHKMTLSNATFVKEYSALGPITEYTVTDLIPGGMYNFTVQRVRDTVEGTAVFVNILAEPEKPRGLSAFNISSHSFSLYWRRPYGRVERYQVDLTPAQGCVAIRDLGGEKYQADVSGISPGTGYTATVSSVSASVYSSPISKSVTTNETIPGPPKSLGGEQVGSAGILLSWNVPTDPNGRILAYYIKYKETCPWMQTVYTEVTSKADLLEVLLTDLNPGTTYEIKIAAENSAGIGLFTERFLFQTAESAPGKVANLTVEPLNSSTVNLTWFLPRQPNGKIIGFKISVKNARNRTVVKDTMIRVEDVLPGPLPECTDKGESFPWTTSRPSSTDGQSATPLPPAFASRTVGPTFHAVWNEPISFIVGHLRPYTTYLFEVSAVTNEPGYIDSTIVRMPESVPEDPPQNLVKTNITAKSFSVAWDPPTILTGKFTYRMELYGPTGHTVENSTKDLKFTFTGLVPFTAYDAYIAGETSAGTGPKANITVFTLADVPSAVHDLNVSEIDSNCISITWKKPRQPNGIITQYRVKVFVKETRAIVENTVLTGSPERTNNPTFADVLKESTTSFTETAAEPVTGVSEGSADLPSMMQPLPSVLLYKPLATNALTKNTTAGLYPASVMENIGVVNNISAEHLSYIVKKLAPYTEYTINVSAFTSTGEGPLIGIDVRTREQGLKKYTDYKIRVTASTKAGESSLSDENDVFVRTFEDEPGSPPQNLVLVGVTATGINLEWSPPKEPNGIVTHYEVIYVTSSSSFTENTTATKIYLKNLRPHTLYSISVRAYTRFGHGNQSTSVLFVRTSETAPSSPPYDLTYSSFNSTAVKVSWKPPVYANGVILFYTINYWNKSHVLNSTTNESSVVLGNLRKFSQYAVVVSPHTIHGNGNQTSDALIMTTLEDVPDDSPHNLSYRNLSSTSVQLFCSPPSSPNGLIQFYTISYLGADGAVRRVNHSDCVAVLSGLRKYSDYSFTVSASTSVGHGPQTSPPLFVRTDEDVPDSPPENITYRNISSTEIVLSFLPPAVPNGIILWYTIYLRRTNGTEQRVLNTSQLSQNITGLNKYTSYTTEVSSSTIKGEGVHSAPIHVVTEEDAPSSPPRSFSVKQLSDAVVKLSWKPPLEPNGIILYYTVHVWNTETRRTINVTETFLDLTDLENNNDYQAYVTASTRYGAGKTRSEKIRFRTSEGAPSDPPKDILYVNLSSTEIKVSWSPPSKPNGIIRYYSIYYMNSSGIFMQNFSIVDVESNFGNTTLSAMLDGLAKFSHYTLWVTASTALGDGNQTSEVIDVYTDQDVPEDSVQNLTVLSRTSKQILLFWLPPLKPHGHISRYELILDANYSFIISPGLSFTSFNLTDLRPFTVYRISVFPYTVKGKGPGKSIALMTDESTPDGPVRSLSYQNVTSTAVNISWLPPLQPNGLVFYHLSLTIGDSEFGPEMVSLITYDTYKLIDQLGKYTNYILKINPATEKGFSTQYITKLHIKTEEDVPQSSPIIRNQKNLTATSVLLSWDPPGQPCGIVIGYDIQLYGPKLNYSFTSQNSSVVLENLLPFTPYKVFLAASTRKGLGPFGQIVFYTEESEPSAPPQNLMVINYTADTARLKWSQSPQPNGIVRMYSFKILENSSQIVFYQNISGLQTEGFLVGLKPFETYFVSVSAFTKIGNGNHSSNTVSFTTKESAPDIVQNVRCVATSWQSILLQWDPPAKLNGLITHYLITLEKVETVVASNENVYTVRELLANTSYQLVIRAVTSAGKGKEQACAVTTYQEEVPSTPRNITFSSIQSTSVTLMWIRPTSVPGYLKNYKVARQLQSTNCRVWESEGCIEDNREVYSYNDDQFIEETIDGLKKFRWYRFRISASTNAGYGPSSNWISVRTLHGTPDQPPENVIVVPTSHQSINITWREPAVLAGPTSYLINVSSVDSNDYKMTFVRKTNESKILEVFDLAPFTRYSVLVVAFTGDKDAAYVEGKPAEPIIATTFEAVPTDPLKILTYQKMPNEVTKFQLTFLAPSKPNGQIRVYQAVVCKEDDPTKSQIHNLSITEKSNISITAVIEGLKGGNTYNISVYAVNGAGAGPKIQLRVTMDIKEPAQPNKRPVPAYDSSGTLLVTSTTIAIKMPVCYFNDDHGPLKNIQVLVAELGAQNSSNITKWHEAYFKKPSPYFANEGFSNPPCPPRMEGLNAKDDVYVIGADDTCILQNSEEKYCNGPLKPRKQYLFKFRATNIKGQFTDSEYSDTVKTLAEGVSERTIEIILAVTLCILSLVLLVAAIFAFARIRQKQKEGGTYSPRDAEIIDTKFKLDQLITVADLELKDERLTRPVSKKTFLQHVQELCMNNNLKFQEEFSELPKFLQDLATTDADLPWNRSKNRFTNIKPYNNNRVKLIADAGVPGSDYINASYVSGYLCPNEFIATQGPLPGTVGDFWRMVWETRTKTIVMLTQCFEKGRIRCHQYWPEDNKPVTVFGDIVITKLVEDAQVDWTIRDIKIEKHGDYMMVRQYNFSSWPEHGVPDMTVPLIHFVRMIRASRAQDNTPIIVHCSAGVGRTGLYIVLDHVIQHINHHDFVDIYGLVTEIRSERMCMVQNLAQYMYLHQCVLELLASKGNNQAICFVNYSALQKMDSLDAMEGDVELEWEETTM
ncbi:phosphatidylinositol phosphatase PTPRQ isoform X2 [Microcaecilia unicolor]|uniref:Phosphatidylinositol phosphatase PTPRQ n=1 Tax=Microcaecilia unicolor TaxID=1415580 RepID=A0A6P7YZR3_9AMPH|nr:phosphatidylinositol phosphatase PTPRQ isoform X2 [Microcaecilia unicolor]